MLDISVEKTIYAACPKVWHPTLDRVKNSEIGFRLARGAFWSMAGAIVSRGLMLVASIAVARILGKTGFGELGMIQSTVGMFGVFAGFGLGLTATKHVAELRQSDPVRAGRILGLSGLVAMLTGGLMAFGLLAFAPWLAEHTINAPHLAGILRIGALILFISALNGAQTGALAGFEAFKTIAHVNLFVGLISFPILVCGVYFGGLPGAVWALAVNLGVNWLSNHLALRKEMRRYNVRFSFRSCGREWSVLWRFSLPAVLAGSMVGPINWACSALLVNQPDGYGEMGIFSAANQWYAMLLFLPALLGQVVLPVLSERLGQRDTKQSMKTMVLAIKANALLVIPLALLMSIASPFIMSLYGEGFRSGWPTLIVVLLTTGLLAVQTPVGQIIAASGRMWIGFAMNLGWGIVFVVSTFMLLRQGSLGLATARAVGYAFHTIWVLGFAYYLLTVAKAASQKGVCSVDRPREIANINTRDYWENRFATGDWEGKLGRAQTRQFAETQVRYLQIAPDFSGKILDFGCGLGDAIPIYRAAYSHASLVGMDISEAAIARCRERYGSTAQFIHGDYTDIPQVDVIIASNVFEHLSDDIKVAAHLLTKCHDLFIITPYKEAIIPGTEHINSYDVDHFKALGVYDYTVFRSRGWGTHGWRLWCIRYPLNLIRLLCGGRIIGCQKQIMFHFRN